MECNNCNSKNTQIVKYQITGGGIQYRYQCKDCGFVNQTSIAHSKLTDDEKNNAPFLDEEARKICSQKMQERYKQEAESEYQEKRQQRFNELNEYYQSEKWQNKRQMRLRLNERLFDGWCERCGMHLAKHIHHRSYAVLGGKEHPFDLEALCEYCHKDLHPHMED